MTHRPHPKYASNDARRGPWANCSDCGFNWSLSDLQFQYDFQGGSVPTNTGWLRCPRCITPLTYQRKLIIIPPDPPPIFNTRPEPYYVDQTDWLTSGSDYDGDIITTGVTSDSGAALIKSQPNPADNADTSVLAASLAYVGTLSVAYLDLFNGDPLAGGSSILLSLTGSATRSNVFSSLEANAANVLLNPAVLTVVSAAATTSNVTHIGIYSAASGGTLLTSGPVSASYPTIVLGAAVQFDALTLQIAQS